MKSFVRVVAIHPYSVALTIASVTAVCLAITLVIGKFPDFSDPQLGFETRGTEIACRLTTWENLQKASRPGGPLVTNPEEVTGLKTTPPAPSKPPGRTKKPKGTSPPNQKPTGPPGNQLAPPRSVPLKGRAEAKVQGPYKYWNDGAVADSDVGRVAWSPTTNKTHRFIGATDRLAETLEEEDWSSLQRPDAVHHNDDDHDDSDDSHDKVKVSDPHDEDEDHDHDHLAPDGFFCEHLSPAYSHLVITPVHSSSSLLSLDSLLAVCRLQAGLMAADAMLNLCQTVRKGQCCPPWSLPNYIAMMYNRSDCFHITEEDVEATTDLLKKCLPEITRELTQNKPGNMTGPCSESSPVFTLLYYLVDARFDAGDNSILQASMLFLPIARSASVLPYYRALHPGMLSNELVTVPASDFGVKGALFDLYLVRGTALMGGGLLVILVSLWVYTGSLFITLCCMAAVLISLFIAYFIYTYAFGISFFPFMNVLAIVVVIGIGADDAFIYCKMWRCSERDVTSGGTVALVKATLAASGPSMLVTSLTTAAALFANCISPITAISCFSIFAGTAVLVNLALMLTWLPACVVIADSLSWPPLIPLQWRPALHVWLRTAKRVLAMMRPGAERSLTGCVVKLRWYWALALGVYAIFGAIAVFHYPKLRLPDTKTFPLFESSHPFEQYETKYKNHFWFERDGKGSSWNDDGGRLAMQFVWGVVPTDDGAHLDPTSRGQLHFDPSFDIAAQESQTWLLQFCRNLRLQPFYQPTLGPLLPNCFIESFKSWMSRRCKDLSGVDRSPCCEASRFPFTRRVFTRCVAKASAHLHATPSSLFTPGVAGPKFARGKRGEIKAIVIEYESNYTYSTSYTEMSEFYSSVESWFQTALSTAPTGLRGGWFVSDLGFWDLQTSLSDGTQAAILVSLGVALLVVFLSTLNLLLSLFTVVTIAAIIFHTVSILVALEWRLNVLEAVAVTTAIGLSVDFSLHYAVHYRLAGEDLRLPAVAHVLTRMSGPTAMSAFTTAAAGAFMLLSSVLPYIQIGILLVVLMGMSWLYATFFLMALLAIAGPERGCGQLPRPSPGAWCREPTVSKPPGVPGMWSDTTLSTSSGHVEMLELEALTRGQRRKRPRSQSPALPEDIEDFPS